MAATKDFTVERGASFSFGARRTPMPNTSTMRCRIGPQYGAPPTYVLTVGNGIEVDGNGIYRISLTPEQTAAMALSKYFYQLDYILASVVERLASGNLQMRAGFSNE